ncbi:MAG: hypothetical protein ACKO3K_01880 [Cuspidothrix sp.]
MTALNLLDGGILDASISQSALKAEINILLTLNPNYFTRLGNAIANIVQIPE